MSAASTALYTALHKKYFMTKDNWPDDVNCGYPADAPVQQMESVVRDMAKDKFNGFFKDIYFWIGGTKYRAHVTPPQNKATRATKAYNLQNEVDAQWASDVVVYQVRPKKQVLNVHLTLRTLASEAKIAAALAAIPDADGWAKVKRR